MFLDFSFAYVADHFSIEKVLQKPLRSFFCSESTIRIREFSLSLFKKISEFFRKAEDPAKLPNLKAVAVASCALLVTLIALSTFLFKEHKELIRHDEV